MSLDTRGDVHTSDTVSVVGKTPMVRRTFYVDETLWNDAKELADEAGTDISTVLRKLLKRYVKRGVK